MIVRRCRLLMLLCMLAAHARAAHAQNQSTNPYEVAAGVRWNGVVKFDASTATLTTASPDRFRLFAASNELERAIGLDVRIGRRIAQKIRAEVALSYTTPVLSSSISSDAENAAPIVATDSIRQAAIEGGGVFDLFQRPRASFFATGGAGYVRELHEGNTLAQSGRLVYAGGGARLPFGGRGGSSRREAGLRVDARAVVRTGDIMLDRRTHVSPVVVVTFFVRL